MGPVRQFFSRLFGAFRRRKIEARLAEEMEEHLEHITAENIATGMSPAEARNAARREFGHADGIKEAFRDQVSFGWIDDLAGDVRYGCRQLVKAPGFTSVAILTLGLGIGFNTAIFTLVVHFGLASPRVADPGTIISVFGADKRAPVSERAKSREVVPHVDYAFYRDHNAVFESLAAARLVTVTLGVGAEAAGAAASGNAGPAPEERKIYVQLVSENYFPVLGARTVLGRTFLPEENRIPGDRAVAVVGFRFWQQQLFGDPAAVGTPIILKGKAYTIVGIAAEDFGGNRLMEPVAWVPMMMAADFGQNLSDRNGFYVDIFGRLKPGVTLEQAQANMDLVAEQNGAARSAARGDAGAPGVNLAPLTARDERQLPVWILIIALVGMLLLIVAANIANLLLARSVSRYGEIGVRLSLGATRGRLIRQLLTESVLIGLLGGVVGLGLASAGSRLLVAFIQAQSNRLEVLETLPPLDLGVEMPVFGYALAVSLLAGIAVGLAPALQATKRDLASALKDEGTVFGRRLSRSRLRNLLVIVQVAFSLALLVGAGLLVRSLQKAQSIDPGFDYKHLLVVGADLRAHGYDLARRTEFYREFAERARQLPGVKSVAYANYVPLQGAPVGPAMGTETARSRNAGYNFVSPSFFTALGTPVLAGRDFREDEVTSATPVAIVNDALARQLWPGENPIGKRLYGIPDDYAEVVGVVANSRNMYLWENNAPYMYFIEHPFQRDLTILVRTEGAPAKAIANIRSTIRAMDPGFWPTIRPLEDDLDFQLLPFHLGAWLSAGLGLVALGVTAIGLYGVIAFATNQRTHEIGIRLALGATSADVLRLVLGQGWRMILIGVVLGLGGAIAIGRLLAQFLYGLSPVDPVAFGGVSLALVSVALLACYFPARRAMRINPMLALRHE